MHQVLALWAFAAVVLPTCEAVLGHRSRSPNVTAVEPRTALRQSNEPLSATLDAALRARREVAKFGPGNCVSTWRNEDGHCELETKCKDQNISKYAVKFLCIDNGGEKVRHVFAAGSFDTEEQFDTLIECKKCLAEKEEIIQAIEDPPKRKVEEKAEEQELGGSPLKGLRNEVKELEAFMWNTSASLQVLNARVYGGNFQPPVHKKPLPKMSEVGNKAAAKALKPASSFVHHGTAHHTEVEAPQRIKTEASQVEREHRRQVAEENGDEDLPSPKKLVKAKSGQVEAVPSSLVGAVRAAEERADKLPPSQQTRAVEIQKPRPLVVSLPKVSDNDNDDDDEGDANADDEEASVPRSAEEYEHRQEAAEKKRPHISSLQRGEDDEDEAADEGDEDGDADE